MGGGTIDWRAPAAAALVALALAVPALINGFPLTFPDTGAYLRIAYGSYFGVERASGYGFFLKPLLFGGTPGLWFGLAVQLLMVAAVAMTTVRKLVPLRAGIAALLLVAAVSSWPWHAAQLMPDAFTAPLVLAAWLLTRPHLTPLATVGFGLFAILAMLMHVTHAPLFVAACFAALAADWLTGEKFKATASRFILPLVLAIVAVATQIGANAAYLGRASLAPGGPLFLYARLNEDGLIKPWLDQHCGEPRIALLCATAPALPRDSQDLLWAGDGPVAGMVWQEGPADLDRWALVDQMAVANRGAIADRPLHFLSSALAGTARQFVAFGAIDDECPGNCPSPGSDVALTLQAFDPAAVPAYARSLQANAGLPVGPVRAITTPIAALALLVLPLVLLLAWRRRDPLVASLAAAILVALLVNAAMAGALSDVHDRYQSRVVWLAVLVAAVAALRWRAQVTADRSANRGSA
jgi:hypothetical protein